MVAFTLLPPERTKVFVSYSHLDRLYMEELSKHLESMSLAGVKYWVDTMIAEGTNWRQEIGTSLDSSKAAILLVSGNFCSSSFIKKVELPYLIESARTEGLRLFPVLVGGATKPALDDAGLLLKQFFPPAQSDRPWGVFSFEERNVCWVQLAEKMAAV